MLKDNSNAEAPIQSGRSPLGQRKGVGLLTMLKVGITILILGYVVHSVDLTAAWQRASSQQLPLVVVAGLIMLVQILLGGTRWLLVLKCLGARPLKWETLKLFYVSIFFNSCMPGGIGGDIIRAWLSYRNNLAAKTAITSVLLDRVAALVGVTALVLVTAPSFLARVGMSMTMLIPLVVSVGGLVGIAVAAQFDRIPERWLRILPLRLLRDLGAAVRLVFLRPASVVPLVGVALLGQAALGFAAYAMAVSLSMNVSLLECMILMQPVALVANLPITVGGWGVRETAMIALFGLIGVPASATLVLSIQLGLLSLLVALPGGLVWLALKPHASNPAVASPP
jgi:uncharacterized protein (TIRG00374 family)